MRANTIVMIGFAVLFGVLAVSLVQTWLNTQDELRMKSLEASKKQPAAACTIVVASKPLRFGNEPSSFSLREAAWPEDSLLANDVDLFLLGKPEVTPALGRLAAGAANRPFVGHVLDLSKNEVAYVSVKD